MEEIIYISRLKFGDWKIWSPMYLGLITTDIIMYFSYLNDYTTIGLIVFIIVLILSLTCILLPNILHLSVKISSNSIKIKVFPFYSKTIKKEAILKLKMNKVNYLNDYFGIGYKYSKKYGYGFITGDGYCLQIQEKTGEIINVSVNKDLQSKLDNYL